MNTSLLNTPYLVLIVPGIEMSIFYLIFKNLKTLSRALDGTAKILAGAQERIWIRNLPITSLYLTRLPTRQARFPGKNMDSSPFQERLFSLRDFVRDRCAFLVTVDPNDEGSPCCSCTILVNYLIKYYALCRLQTDHSPDSTFKLSII